MVDDNIFFENENCINFLDDREKITYLETKIKRLNDYSNSKAKKIISLKSNIEELKLELDSYADTLREYKKDSINEKQKYFQENSALRQQISLMRANLDLKQCESLGEKADAEITNRLEYMAKCNEINLLEGKIEAIYSESSLKEKTLLEKNRQISLENKLLRNKINQFEEKNGHLENSTKDAASSCINCQRLERLVNILQDKSKLEVKSGTESNDPPVPSTNILSALYEKVKADREQLDRERMILNAEKTLDDDRQTNVSENEEILKLNLTIQQLREDLASAESQMKNFNGDFLTLREQYQHSELRNEGLVEEVESLSLQLKETEGLLKEKTIEIIQSKQIVDRLNTTIDQLKTNQLNLTSSNDSTVIDMTKVEYICNPREMFRTDTRVCSFLKGHLDSSLCTVKTKDVLRQVQTRSLDLLSQLRMRAHCMSRIAVLKSLPKSRFLRLPMIFFIYLILVHIYLLKISLSPNE